MQRIENRDQIITLAEKNGLISAMDLYAYDIPREYLSRLAKQGVLERVGHGLYQLPGKDLGRHQTLMKVVKQVPGGVIALLSALNYHQFTTQNPFEVWVAVDRRAWKPSFDYPPVRFVSISGDTLTQGVEEHQIEGGVIKVFCPAKTVADCFKYRNKIGLDVALEALREGWRERRFTLKELSRYAAIDRVLNIMRPYMESLL